MTIFLDFNGTVIDDLDLTFSLLNELLIEEGHKPITLNQYLNIFGFPIKDYYIKAGFDFRNSSFEELAGRFIKRYQPKSFKLNLHDNVVETVLTLKDKGYDVILLSASQRDNLIEQLSHFKINNLFNDILGIEDIYAQSKVDLAKSYIASHDIDPSNIVVVGDTLHDKEVADSIGAQTILFSKGHQAKSRFKDVTVIENFNELIKEIEKCRKTLR